MECNREDLYDESCTDSAEESGTEEDQEEESCDDGSLDEDSDDVLFATVISNIRDAGTAHSKCFQWRLNYYQH